MDIIKWCNQNQGFLSFVLSVVTIFISVIALFTSKNLAKIPFKVKIKAIPMAYTSSDGPYIDLVIFNQGYIKIGISDIHILDDNNIVIGMYEGTPVYVESASIKKCKIGIFPNGEEHMNKHIMNLNDKISITIYDTFGNKYIFKNGFPIG